jgi:hypothetical protein
MNALPRDLLEYLSRMPEDTFDLLSQMALDESHAMHDLFESAYRGLAPELVEGVTTIPHIQARLIAHGSSPTSELTKAEIVHHVARAEIQQLRTAGLLGSENRPAPLQHPALAGVRPDKYGLVSIGEFRHLGSHLERNGFIFSLACALPTQSSQHWCTAVLFGLNDPEIRIRLDPLIALAVSDYRPPLSKVLHFGRNLDWARIAKLRGAEFARWIPDHDDVQSDIEFTELVWWQRENLVSFECEEVPKPTALRPARYFHAFLETATLRFTHADAAVRFYSPREHAARANTHLKDLDKVGMRIKLFNLGAAVSLVAWSELVASAFAWNSDLQRYFIGELSLKSDPGYAPRPKTV